MNYLITDSIGCYRKGIDAERIYTRALKRRFPDLFARAYYSMTINHLIDILTGIVLLPGEKIITQVGIVDCVTNGLAAGEFVKRIEENEGLFRQVWPIGVFYYGPNTGKHDVSGYNRGLKHLFKERYIGVERIENCLTLVDGIHLNNSGHDIMAEVVAEVLCRQ